MEDNSIVEMIKKQDSKKALKEMEKILKKVMLEKINKDEIEKTKLEKLEFMNFLDYCISSFSEYYDLLTYLRNIYFFSEKTDNEKLYELAYVFEAIVN